MNWWKAKTSKNFKNKAQCIIRQYGNYTVNQVGLKLNGVVSQGENIADNGGTKEAYLGYGNNIIFYLVQLYLHTMIHLLKFYFHHSKSKILVPNFQLPSVNFELPTFNS